ncbi:MAG: DinB family protein [Fimbriimonadaceae bacterium]
MSSDLQQRLESTTLAQWQARQIEKAAHILSVFVESTPEDKLRWRPMADEKSNTRSVLDQVGECVFANNRFRSIFSGDPLPTPPDNFDTFSSGADATAQLKASANALANLIREMDSAALAKEYNTHRGPLPGAFVMQLPLRNMTYHMGQVNMIQLLYGDTEFHIDEEFTTL